MSSNIGPHSLAPLRCLLLALLDVLLVRLRRLVVVASMGKRLRPDMGMDCEPVYTWSARLLNTLRRGLQ